MCVACYTADLRKRDGLSAAVQSMRSADLQAGLGVHTDSVWCLSEEGSSRRSDVLWRQVCHLILLLLFVIDKKPSCR